MELKVDKIILLKSEKVKDFFDKNLIRIQEFGVICGKDAYIFKEVFTLNEKKWQHFVDHNSISLIIENNTMTVSSPLFKDLISCSVYKTNKSEIVEKLL